MIGSRYRFATWTGRAVAPDAKSSLTVWCTPARAGTVVAFDRARDDWRTFRIDRIAGRATGGDHFTPRPVPGADLADFVSRSVGTNAYTYRAKILLHAPLARVAERVPPLAGQLTAVSKRRCLLEAGANSLSQLAWFVATLGEEFEVQSPPELIDELAALEQRVARAVARHK